MRGMVVSFAAALLLQKAVALPNGAMRLDALLKAMSLQAGQTYRASETMAPRIVLVAGPARPPSALCADLAKATFGHWRQVGNEWSLDEDRDAVKARERRRLAARIEEIKTQQQKMRADLGKPFDAERAKALLAALNASDKAEKSHPNQMTPEWEKADRLKFSDAIAKRLVASLDPFEIAALTKGRAVYTERPTRLQRPLPAPLAQAATVELAHAQAVWASVFTDSTDWKAGRQSWMSDDPRGYPDPISPGDLRVYLRVQAFEHGQTMFNVEFIDRAGKERQFGTVSINFSDHDERPDPSPKVDPQEPPIPLPAEAKAYSDLQMGRGSAPFLRPILLHPETREPLDLLFGAGLRGVAQARQTSVVAWLADDVARNGLGKWKGAGSEPSASGWLRAMWLFGYEVDGESGSTIVRPRAGGQNVDRARLGKVCQTMDRVGYLPLDDAADYALATNANGQSADTLASVLFENAVPGAFQLMFRTNWSDLAVWGGFSRAQRQAILEGSEVPWAAISAAQHDRIVQEILQADPNEIQRTGRGGRASYDNVLSNEPTEVLADGSAMGNGVHGRGRVEAAVFVKSTDDNPYNGGLASAASLASAVVAREREPNVTHYDGLPKQFPDGFLYGREVTIQYTIDLSPALRWNKYGQFGEIDLRKPAQPLEGLPGDFRAEYERFLANARKPEG